MRTYSGCNNLLLHKLFTFCSYMIHIHTNAERPIAFTSINGQSQPFFWSNDHQCLARKNLSVFGTLLSLWMTKLLETKPYPNVEKSNNELSLSTSPECNSCSEYNFLTIRYSHQKTLCFLRAISIVRALLKVSEISENENS